MLNDTDLFGSNLEREYRLLCQTDEWNLLFQRIKNNASLKMINNECTISRSNENRLKNKYRDVVPYDYNRILLPQSSDSNSDYINASHVKFNKRSYIVTQYPYNTIDIFWLMIWHFKSPGVIMLGKFHDSESVSYFPKIDKDLFISSSENKSTMFVIKLFETFTFNGFFQRKLRITHVETDTFHDLWHFEFWSWPDHGAPSCLFSFLTLMGMVRQNHILDSTENPAVIHCSAGAGRSGTFCLIDLILLQMENQKNLDNIIISEVIEELRVQRMGMVHSTMQLKFSYIVIIEAFNRLKSNNFKILNGSYLLCNEEAHVNNFQLSSSSSSESSASDIVYYQLSDEDINSEDDSSCFSNEYHLNQYYEEILEESETECNSSKLNEIPEEDSSVSMDQVGITDNSNTNRDVILSNRKLKNQRNIDILSKHLKDNNLKRYRFITNITQSSTISLLDEINNNYYWSIFIVGGTIFFMGACLWLKYNPFK